MDGVRVGKKVDLTNLVSGRLTAIRDSGMKRAGKTLWECKCECGNTIFVTTAHFNQGLVRSCGCLYAETRGLNRLDLTGREFGRLTAIRDSGQRRRDKVLWECQCECGTTVLVSATLLKNGLSRSCGCLKRDVARESHTTHEMTGTPEYHLFHLARQRARAQGLAFGLTLEDIVIPAVCPALGIPLTVGDAVQHDRSPSLDRLRPDLGYVSGNVAVISLLANRMKQNADSAQVRAVAQWLESQVPERSDAVEMEGQMPPPRDTRSGGPEVREPAVGGRAAHGMSGTPEYRMLKSARRRARVAHVPCTLTVQDIHIPEFCPALRFRLEHGKRKSHESSPTLDRLQPDLGYTPVNTAVISYKANTIKQNGTGEQLLALAAWMESLGL